MDYREKHATSLASLREKNAPEVVFTREIAGEYDARTDTSTESTTEEIRGLAVEIPGDPEEYEREELVASEAATLMFVPLTYNHQPSLHSTVMWAGKLRTVRQVFPIRPSGETIAVRVLVT